MRMFRAIALSMALSLLAPAASSGQTPCKTDARVVGSCFKVHGRFSFYNGNPSFRIWPVGTHRLLGVTDDPELLPPNLEPFTRKPDGPDVYGDFEVCPLTVEHEGWMQTVCVESATNLVTSDRRRD